MAEPLTWAKPGEPGPTWDSELTWDGVKASTTKPKTVNTKAIIDFSGYAAGDLGTTAQNIHDKLAASATVFTAPPGGLPAFQALIADYEAKRLARESNATEDINKFSAARDALETRLGALGSYVNGVAEGQGSIVDLSGVPSYDTSRTVDTAPPAAPRDLRLIHPNVSGGIRARYKPDRQPSVNEIQANTGDPNNEAGWVTKGLFQGGKADLTGFTPGAVIWIRVRTVGLKGVMGAWSDPAQIRVL